MRYLGCHISIAGGFDKCIDRIAERGGNCLMTFASSPRSLQTKPLSDADIEVYLEKKKMFKIGPHFFHGVYLVNLATDKDDYLKASVESLRFYQDLAAKIDGEGTIFHLGSGVGEKTVVGLNRVLAATPKGVKLFLENAAGQGQTMGKTFEQLAQLINAVEEPEKIGVCLDTQHAFAAGYDLTKVLDDFNRIIGLKYLNVIHLNDSKTEFGSNVDRHENLGDGKIGSKLLKQFINDPRLKDVPFILEVPGDGDGPRKEDIDSLKKMVV